MSEGLFYIDEDNDPSVEYRTSRGNILIVTFDRERKQLYVIYAGKDDDDLTEYLPVEFMQEVMK